MNYQGILQGIYQNVSNEENIGKVATYIPELAKVDPNKFGVSFLSVDNEEFGFGDWQTKFSIQSVSKVLSLSLAYKLLGDSLWERVGVEPSGDPFNSLVQLETENGIPRNPLINGGAIVICDMLISNLKDAKKEFIEYVREIGSNQSIHYCESTAKSEEEFGFRNKALCNFMKSRTFLFLANSHCSNAKGDKFIELNQAKRINAIMQTCGFYDESGDFSFKVGLPGKSGVGGGIVAIHPGNYTIAVWSPRLNEKGNSYRGMKLLESFTTETKLSIF